MFKCVCVFALFGKEREDDEDVGDDDDDANPMIDVSAPSAATFFTTLILGGLKAVATLKGETQRSSEVNSGQWAVDAAKLPFFPSCTLLPSIIFFSVVAADVLSPSTFSTNQLQELLHCFCGLIRDSKEAG